MEKLSLCIVLLTFRGKRDARSQKIKMLVNIIHGYIISLFMHRSALSMDTDSHFSCKVTLSMDNATLCTVYSAN